ncbi:MAG: ATP-grasp domain-containing protein [Cyclobacteriaceae bacterium]|nr:ATP-grasp domain-containing protein [Cyclobacteriaceae bacterium HetDA_MAG_MS6]
MESKRVFVSGGAGVIGRELVKKLVDLKAVVMVGDLMDIPQDFPSNVLYRRGDLNYITQQEVDHFNPEIFIHLAATFERSQESYEHWEENFWHNIRLSNHLMTLMRNAPALKRVVYASSYLIYDKILYTFYSPQDQPIRLKETDSISPRNLTGLAKLSHEIELEFLSHFKSNQFSYICARIYRGYGKNSRDVISRWVRDLLASLPIKVYCPEGWFDYIHAEDSAEGLIRLAQIEATGIVNLGTGQSRRVEDVVQVLREHFPDMEAHYESSDIKYEASEADTQRLQSLLNWTPTRNLENTIPELIDYEKKREQNSPVLKNVLITSISKKVPMIKAIKNGIQKVDDSIKVFGADIDENCLGKYFVDSFWKMPKLDNLSAEQLLEFCESNHIGLIIPSRDGELGFFARQKSFLSEKGIHVMVADDDKIAHCVDKLTFGALPTINAIPASENIKELNGQSFVVKERFGAGAISIGINLNKNEALEHSRTLKHPIYQPYIQGKEVSIDAYITRDSEVKGLVIRTRDVIVNGESQVTTTLNDAELEETFKNILQELKLYGHVVLQAIIDDKKTVHLIECNPRFGGASTLSLQAGLDSFYWVYLESMHIHLQDYPFIKNKTKVTQVRYPQDFYL